MNARIRINVSGIVQGVGYRYYTFRTARKLSLTGYVQNKPNGTVEVVAEGEKSNLLRLIEELRIGPPNCSVENLSIKWEPPKSDLQDFRILK